MFNQNIHKNIHKNIMLGVMVLFLGACSDSSSSSNSNSNNAPESSSSQQSTQSTQAKTTNNQDNKNKENKADPTANYPVYTVMSEVNTIPFIIHDEKQEHSISGFEYDLLSAIAEQQQIKLKFEFHPWQGLFDNLNTGKADIVAGAVTYTDERAKTMDFANSHFDYHYTIMAKPEFADKKSFAELKGKNIALQRGSVSETLIPMFANPEKNNIILTETIWLAVKNVMGGNADGAVGSSAPLGYYAKQYPDSKVVLIQDPSLPAQHYAFAVKKGNAELLKKLNNGLAAIKSTGKYDELYKKYW